MATKTQKIYWIALGVLILIHVIIFRDLLWHLPQLLSGSEVVVREELVPFFDFQNQFWNQIQGGYSELTSSSEVRISYSFLTAWVRHYQILPFALILLNALAAFILFLSFYWVAREYFKKEGLSQGLITWMSFLGALVIHLILLYSKVTHFYTLIAGFALFALALSLFLIEILYRDKISWSKVLLITLLVLLNPAIHYHVLFYIASLVLTVFGSWFVCRAENANYKKVWGKSLLMFFVILVASALPYGLFVLSTAGDDVSSSIPAIHYIIKGASLPLTHLFSLDSSSQVDMFLFGVYIPLDIRWMKLFYIVLILLGLWQMKKQKASKRVLPVLLLVTTFLAFWMAMGYTEEYSFHNVLRTIATFLTGFPNVVTYWILKLLYIFMEILRLPNRFQFISYYSVGLLLVLATVQLYTLLIPKLKSFRTYYISLAVTALLFMLPLLALPEYRDTLLSGNFHGFINPWPVSPDLVKIKETLHARNDGRMLILPTLESGRITGSPTTGYNNFIDKFFIYYLAYPTLYYGTSSDLNNKLIIQLVYRSILYNQDWWNHIIVNIPDLKYILVNKEISYRKVGQVYIPQLEESLYIQIQKSPYLSRVYEGEQFDLYEIRRPAETGTKIQPDLDWNTYLQLALKSPQSLLEQVNLIPLSLSPAPLTNNNRILTDNVRRTVLDLYLDQTPAQFYKPETFLFPFDGNILPSTIYTNTMPSMTALYGNNNFYRQPVPGMYQAVDGQFFALKPSDTKITIPFNIAARNKYDLLFRLNNAGGTLHYSLFKDDKLVTELDAHNEDTVTMMSGFDYEEVYTGILDPGTYKLVISNVGEKMLYLDGLAVISRDDLPFLFEETTTRMSFKAENQKIVITPEAQSLFPENMQQLKVSILNTRSS